MHMLFIFCCLTRGKFITYETIDSGCRHCPKFANLTKCLIHFNILWYKKYKTEGQEKHSKFPCKTQKCIEVYKIPDVVKLLLVPDSRCIVLRRNPEARYQNFQECVDKHV